jgi:hypothetical protein
MMGKKWVLISKLETLLKVKKMSSKSVNDMISAMSSGQKEYEKKQSEKKGFENLEKYLESKLKNLELSKQLDRTFSERKVWKTVYEDFWRETKGTPQGKMPFFNINYYTKSNPNYVEGKSTKTSKEMMEWFLKTFGNCDPFDPRIEENYKMGIWYCWEKLLDLDTDEQQEDFAKPINPEPFTWFSELEHMIKNDQMFFALFQKVWVYGSHLISNKEEMFSRYGRSQLTFVRRLKSGEYLNTELTLANGEVFADGKQSVSHHGLKSDFVVSLLSNLDDEDYIEVYRSFNLHKSGQVRKSNLKTLKNGESNPDYYEQVDGKGWSYSIDQFCAVRIAWNINTHHFSKYCGFTQKKALRNMVRKGWITPAQKCDSNLLEGNFKCVGKYLVKKKDILLFTDSREEREVIVNPKNALLVDYYFLNLVDHLTVRAVLQFDSIMKDSIPESAKCGLPVNVDYIYKSMRPIVSRYFYKYPKQMSELLEVGFKSRHSIDFFNNIFDLFKEFYEVESFGQSIRCYDEKTQNTFSETLFCNMNGDLLKFIDKRKNRFRNSNRLFDTQILNVA